MAIPILNHLDLRSVSELQNAILHKTTEAVASDVEGKIIYDTGSNSIKYNDGTEWVSLVAVYALPNASSTVLGGIKVGTNLSISVSGTLSSVHGLSPGNEGLVPSAGTAGHFLKHDGTFGLPAYTTDTDTWTALTGTVSGYVTTQGASNTALFLNGNGAWSTPAYNTLAIGSLSTDAMAGDAAVDNISVANLKTALAGGFGLNAVQIGDGTDTVTIPGNLIITSAFNGSTGVFTSTLSALGGTSTQWNTAYGWGDWSTGVDKAFVDALNVDADTLDGLSSAAFELAFSKNTAFNKDFGTALGTTAQGNDSRINNGQTAYSWGDHALPGYLLASNEVYLDAMSFAGGTLTLGRNNAIDISVSLDGRYELLTNKGVALGYAPLDSGAKISETYLPDSILGQLDYQSTWAANTNTPTIPAAATANKGHYYVTTGTANVGHGYANVPNKEFNDGDWIISNGTAWEIVDNSDAVTTVFGRIGGIVANAGDYNATQVTFTPYSTLASVTVQAAIQELRDESATAAQGTLADSAMQSIASDSVTMDMLSDIDTDTFLGRVSALSGTVEILTNAQAKTALDLSGTNSGDNAVNSLYSGLVSDVNHNVSTNLSEGTSTTTTVDVNSSDGNNATLVSATTVRAGLMSKAKFDEVAANTLKVSDVDHNVTTDLSFTRSSTTVTVASSDGDNAILPEATTSLAGVLGAGKWNEIVANTAKVIPTDFVSAASGGTFGGAITATARITALQGVFNQYIVIQNGAGATTGLVIDSSYWSGVGHDLYVATEAGKKLILSTNGSAVARLTVETSGLVTIGNGLAVTGAITSDTAQMSQWSGDGRYARFGHEDQNGTTSYGYLQFQDGTVYLRSGTGVHLAVNGGAEMSLGSYLAVTGAITATSTVTSDAFRSNADSVEWSLMFRNDANPALYVQKLTGQIASFRYGSSGAGDGTEVLAVNTTGIAVTNVNVTGLAGTGTRMVVANAAGTLSTQAIPTGGGGGVSGSGTAGYWAKWNTGTQLTNSGMFDSGNYSFLRSPSGSLGGLAFQDSAGNTRGYVYHGGSDFGLLYAGGWGLRITGSLVESTWTHNIAQSNGQYQIEGIPRVGAVMSGVYNYTALYSGTSGSVAVYLGGSGDPRNYFDNTSHRWRSIGGATTYATLDSTGLAVTGAIDVGEGIKVTGFTPSTGLGIELAYTGGVGIFQTYNRTGAVYLPTIVDGLTTKLNASGATKLEAISTGIAVTGAITATTTVTALNFIDTSDSRLKKELDSPVLGMELIKLIEPKNYLKNGRQETGLYADKLHEKLSYMSFDIADGYKGLDYKNLHAIEITALQEHDSEIDSLKKKVNELEIELKELR